MSMGDTMQAPRMENVLRDNGKAGFSPDKHVDEVIQNQAAGFSPDMRILDVLKNNKAGGIPDMNKENEIFMIWKKGNTW